MSTRSGTRQGLEGEKISKLWIPHAGIPNGITQTNVRNGTNEANPAENGIEIKELELLRSYIQQRDAENYKP